MSSLDAATRAGTTRCGNLPHRAPSTRRLGAAHPMGCSMRGVLSVLFVACVACDGGGGGDVSEEVAAVLDLTGDATEGAVVFGQSCGASTCHGADGSGGEGVDLNEHIPEHTDAQLVELMINGEGEMPATGLSAQEEADVLAYLRETFGG